MIKKKNDFKDRIDKELNHIHFSHAKRERVLSRIEKPRGVIRNFLEKEIAIPAGLFASVCFITATVVVFAYLGNIRVTQDDMRKSNIVIIEDLNGGKINGIYQN